jgi:HPt (histidine-containing phosphotransfer) domain-containing protein
MNINTELLRKLLGSEEAAQRFVTLFQQQLPGQLEALRQAFAEQDWETLSNTAHGLKSQCKYLGLEEAADLLQKIENNPSETKKEELITINTQLGLS